MLSNQRMSRPVGLRIGARTRSAIDVLDVTGDSIPHAGDATLLQRVTRLLDAGSCLFVFNLTGGLHLDSALLGEVVACRERIRKRGGALKLVLTPDQSDLLVASGLDFLFEVFLDEEEALDSFAAVSATAGIP